jgi:hypothetical protein
MHQTYTQAMHGPCTYSHDSDGSASGGPGRGGGQSHATPIPDATLHSKDATPLGKAPMGATCL